MLKRNNFPKISIITPSYNQGKYLEACIQSVVSQEYPNLEYLIMDGGSTDSSVSIIKKYAKKFPNIIKWRSKKDGGQVSAINEGLKLATGDIVAYLNSDDGYLPETFNRVSSALGSNASAAWLTGSYMRRSGSPSLLATLISFYISFLQLFYSYSLQLVLNLVPQPSTFWKRKYISKIGHFDPKYKLAFDYEYWLRLGKISKPIILRRPLSYFTVHPLSKSSQGFVEQFNEQYSIAKKYTSNLLLLGLHWMHSYLVILPIYNLTK